MKLTDILPLEKWIELENKIMEKSNSCANVYDPDGFKIIKDKKWPNQLCSAINHDKNGQTAICAPAHQNLAALAKKTGKGIAEECDAGIVKIVVPIFVKDEFAGSVGCCGLMFEDGEVESFLINKIMGMDDDEIESLSREASVISEKEAREIIDFIYEQLDRIIDDFEKKNISI